MIDYFPSPDIAPYRLFYLAVYDTLRLVSAILDISLCEIYEEIYTFLLGLWLAILSLNDHPRAYFGSANVHDGFGKMEAESDLD